MSRQIQYCWAVAFAFALHACGAANAALEPTYGASASVARLGPPSLHAMGAGPVSIEFAYAWRPNATTALVTWIACRGSGDARACWLMVGRPLPTGAVQGIGMQSVGWSVPRLGETADRTQLIVQGDDGRGVWRAVLYYDPGPGSVYLGRRLYEDGM